MRWYLALAIGSWFIVMPQGKYITKFSSVQLT